MKEPDYHSKAHKIEMFHAFLDGKKLEESNNFQGRWSEWRECNGDPYIENNCYRYRIKPTQETMDYAAWREWEVNCCLGTLTPNETNFKIWQAALAWERSKNG